MESEFILNLKEISVQAIVIAVLVFALTMLIKWPIKKATAKFDESKRKAVNTVIVFIPMFLSLVFSSLYLGIFKKEWFKISVLDLLTTSYVLALTIYAFYSRVVILIKGSKSSSKKKQDDLSKETIKYIKGNIKTISKTLKLDEEKLGTILADIEKLLIVRDEVQGNLLFQDISQAEKIEKQLNALETEKQDLTNEISAKKVEVESYKNTLKKKGV